MNLKCILTDNTEKNLSEAKPQEHKYKNRDLRHVRLTAVEFLSLTLHSSDTVT